MVMPAGIDLDRAPAAALTQSVGDDVVLESGDQKRLTRSRLLKTAAAALTALLLRKEQVDRAFARTRIDRDTRSSPADRVIVRCAIHPGIGIARVGNSPHDYFIGPEVPGVTPDPHGTYKDAQGRIKRQAARFRIYGLNAHGQVVKELTAHDADITWTVHLANKKAAWYQFKLALDIPEAASPTLPNDLRTTRRNARYRSHDRAGLVIDPGSRSIKGKNNKGPAYHFDTGSFLGQRVALGELRTGADGHLLVLGGLGRSGTTEANNPPTRIANNDGWFDDTSDGPVRATVVFRGRALPCAPAWVIVGPPNYAPGITPVVTLYDVAYQAYLDAGPRTARPIQFTRDIYPILERFDRWQWVNEGFFKGYGWQGEIPFLAPDRLALLAANAASSMTARQDIFNRFRDPLYGAMQEDAWPRIYGDAFLQPPASPRQYLAMTREQYRRLHEWAAGNFVADWNPDFSPPPTLDDYPLQGRPAALDRAALESCSGGPFHPGEEATWIMRHPSLYANLCRLRVRTAGDPPEPNYGEMLLPARALGPDGPLHRSGPGDITRWMAIPWQTDTSNCGSAYSNSTIEPPALPDLPTFWPAIVPNKVVTEQAYMRILDIELSDSDRHAAFQQRVPWARHLPIDYTARNNEIITAWNRLGFVIQQPGPGDESFPPDLYVETENGFPDSHLDGHVSTSATPSSRGESHSPAAVLNERRAHL
ncbi:MAG: LodA/GoxA family CTQ-dependent oxidase [Chloroflexota bacterium]